MRRPQDLPHRRPERDPIPRTDRLDARSMAMRGLEQFRDRLRPRGGLEQRVVHDEPIDPGVPDHVDGATEVVEIRMTDDERLDATTAGEGPWQDAASGHGAGRARTDIEDDVRPTDLDEMRRSISDRKGHERHSRIGDGWTRHGDEPRKRDCAWNKPADDENPHAPRP
jgi:hypothetical protein